MITPNPIGAGLLDPHRPPLFRLIGPDPIDPDIMARERGLHGFDFVEMTAEIRVTGKEQPPIARDLV